MTVVAIVQARMGSSRLPGKVLMEIVDKPMLQHVVERAAAAPGIDRVVVATTTDPQDDAVAALAEAMGVAVERGSVDDVLDRYVRAARNHDAEVVVRITGDCPVLDPQVVGRVVAAFQEADVDYASNVDPPTYPDGLDTEVIAMAALETAWREARAPSEREHVTTFIRRHPERFSMLTVQCDRDLAGLRWTVDEPQDLAFIRAVYDRLGTTPFGMAEMLRLLEKEPDLAQVNAGIDRNEGYRRSLDKDAVSGFTVPAEEWR